ncbi:MAG: hypothetical protein KDA49_10300, partial [Rhodospirillaceae bacterium]|nr:hypothetical protein [Rhodospirillaceae bacterium]
MTAAEVRIADLLAEPWRGRHPAPLVATEGGRPVVMHRFPDGPTRRLVIAGVHGSERSGVEVAERLIALLEEAPCQGTDTLVIANLFPDNTAIGLREGDTPTNRNFPPQGRLLDGDGLDALGRPVLAENRALLAVIAAFRPDRIASVHATVFPERAGIFADPHVDADGRLDRVATAADAALALDLARHAAARGARVPGNTLNGADTSLWSGDVADGVSLGSWGPCPVRGPGGRPSIGVITVEIDGLARSIDADAPPDRTQELTAFAYALSERF